MNIAGIGQTALDTKDTGTVSPITSQEQVQKTQEPARDVDKTQTGEENQSSKMSREEVEVLVADLRELTENLHTKLNFSINEPTNDIVVKIIEKDTDEVIKQFPPEELLELQEKMMDLTGFLFDADV